MPGQRHAAPARSLLPLAAACFTIGGLMELFMIKTGFYDIVTKTEAERWEEHRAEREARARALQASIVEQFRARGREPPREVLTAAGLADSGGASVSGDGADGSGASVSGGK